MKIKVYYRLMKESPQIPLKNPHAVALGRKGGRARREALTPERRSEIARAAITARWDRVRAAKKSRRKKVA